MKWLVFFPLFFAAFASAKSNQRCPSHLGTKNDTAIFNNTCYQFITDTELQYDKAEAYCEKNGGYLATIKSIQVNNFIKRQLNGYSNFFWIGLRYEVDKGRYVWEDNSGMIYNHLSFQSNTSQDECVAFNPITGNWENFVCKSKYFGYWDSSKYSFICQYPTETPPTPTTPSETDKGSISINDCPSNLKRDKYLKAFGDQCFRFEVNNWGYFYEAENYCKNLGGHLAYVKTKEVNNFLQKQLSNYGFINTRFWIGLTYKSEYGFYWEDGSKMNFHEFRVSSFDPSNTCVAMVAETGEWKIEKCKKSIYSNILSKNKFICQFKAEVPNIKDCPIGLPRDEYLKLFGENCYRFNLAYPKSFNDAQKICEKDDGHLAFVKSDRKNNFLVKELEKFGRDNVWIGAHYDTTFDKLVWEDGSDMSYKHFDSRNILKPDECVALNARNGKWFISKCKGNNFWENVKKYYVCEYAIVKYITTEVTTSTTTTTTTTQPTTTISNTAIPENDGITKQNCPKNIPRDEYLQVFGDQCYRFEVERKKDFDDAENYCEDQGGHLAYVKSKKINSFLMQKLRNFYVYDKSLFWIGLSFENEDYFYWQDGSRMGYDNFPKNIIEVNNECVAMDAETGLWETSKCQKSDYSSTPKNMFICQFQAEDPTIEDCPSQLLRDEYLQVYGNNCYRFELNSPLIFETAALICNSEGGHLVSVKSESLNTFLVDQLRNTYNTEESKIWIGAHYDYKQHKLIWEDGTGLTYRNFNKRNRIVPGECAMLNPKDGKWFTTNCERNSYNQKSEFYVCQYPINTQTSSPSTPTVIPTTTPITVPTTSITPTIPTDVQDCPSGLERDEYLKVYGKHCYRFHLNSPKHFDEARKVCQVDGGDLALVKSSKIDTFLVDELQKSFRNEMVWIGAHYDWFKNRIDWEDGSKISFNKFRNPTHNLLRKCAAIDPINNYWKLFPCERQIPSYSSKLYFVCQYEINSKSSTSKVTTPTTTTTPTTKKPTIITTPTVTKTTQPPKSTQTPTQSARPRKTTDDYDGDSRFGK